MGITYIKNKLNYMYSLMATGVDGITYIKNKLNYMYSLMATGVDGVSDLSLHGPRLVHLHSLLRVLVRFTHKVPDVPASKFGTSSHYPFLTL